MSEGAGAQGSQEPTLENAITSLVKMVDTARTIENRVMHISLQLDRPAPQPPSQLQSQSGYLEPQGKTPEPPGSTLPNAIIPAFHELLRSIRMAHTMTNDHLSDIVRKIGTR